MTSETALQDNDRAYERQRQGLSRWQERAADEAHWRAKQAARDAFANLNGWRATSVPHDLGLLGRGVNAPYSYARRDWPLLDHSIWLRLARRLVAAVGQPYMDAADIPGWRDQLTERGFVLHVPPDPLAGSRRRGRN
jgi:hypothetical protein